MRSIWINVAFLSICVSSFHQKTVAQDLQVLVLDALNGKPQSDVEIQYFCTGPQGNTKPGKSFTGVDGSATISNQCGTEEEIEITIYTADKKEQCGVGPLTLKDILSKGIVTHPDAAGGIWCPAKISRNLRAKPGQVVMFVKKPTWWQSHFAGD